MQTDLILQILSFLQTIPKQKVSTYKLIWDKFWVHPRTVAWIMKQNKEPQIYPCYKVVANDWKISWYNTNRWVKEKQELLEKDWIEIINGKVDKKYFYRFTE